MNQQNESRLLSAASAALPAFMEQVIARNDLAVLEKTDGIVFEQWLQAYRALRESKHFNLNLVS